VTPASRAAGALVIAAVVALASGCGFGIGSTYVGQWRARSEVEYAVCVEDETGECVERAEVVSEVPARRFWGTEIVPLALGVGSISGAGAADTTFAVGASFEYLRGRGGHAFGIRAGFQHGLGGGRSLTAVPLAAVGHLGLSDRFATYAGLGLSPFNVLTTSPGEDDAVSATSHRGLYGVTGLQTVLVRNEETRTILALEGAALRIDFGGGAVSSLSATFYLGIFL
jgi:hypothetical protein